MNQLTTSYGSDTKRQLFKYSQLTLYPYLYFSLWLYLCLYLYIYVFVSAYAPVFALIFSTVRSVSADQMLCERHLAAAF